MEEESGKAEREEVLARRIKAVLGESKIDTGEPTGLIFANNQASIKTQDGRSYLITVREY